MTQILWLVLFPCISLEVLATIALRVREVLAYNDCDWMQEKNIGASALVAVGGWWANNDLLTGTFANDGVSSQTSFRGYLGACL